MRCLFQGMNKRKVNNSWLVFFYKVLKNRYFIFHSYYRLNTKIQVGAMDTLFKNFVSEGKFRFFKISCCVFRLAVAVRAIVAGSPSFFSYFPQAGVIWSEIMTPLGNTVSFINSHERNILLFMLLMKFSFWNLSGVI